jgi:RecA-family ATPase
MDAAAVLVRRRRYWANGYRPLEIWNPDQTLTDAGDALRSPGKQPRGPQWQKRAMQNPPEAVRLTPDTRSLGTGLLCERIIGVDVDVPVQALADLIVNLAETTFTPTPLARIGLAPKILLVYRTETAFTKIQTRELFLPDGSKCKVELLARGQQFVADGIHPDTGKPYWWTGETPETVRLDELPAIDEAAARAFIAEAEHRLRQAGAADKKRPHAANGHDHASAAGNAGKFFAEVNRAALRDIKAWVRALFPRARFEPGTGAWRVSSADLGRALEEDISVHPDGIRDFGEEEPRTAIDLALRYANLGNPLDAAQWLCARLGIDPVSLGYIRANGANGTKPNGQVNGHAGNGQDQTATAAPPLWETCRLDVWARSGQAIPPRSWIMEDWIPSGQTTGLYGVSGVLKTMFLLQLMMAASAGLAFCGLPIAAVPVYGLFCEDTRDEILRRVQRIAQFYQRNLEQFPSFHFASLVGQMDSELLLFDLGKRQLGPAFNQFTQELDCYQPGLVVLDTLPDFFGGEEINRRQTSQFIRMLDGISMRYGCAIVCAAHPSMRGRASGRLDSGNTGIEAKMRARLTLHDPGDQAEEDETPEERAYRIAVNPTGKRILTRQNSNYAKPGETIELVIKNGVFAPASIDPAEAARRGPNRDRAVQTLVVELLTQTKQEGRYVNNVPLHPATYAPRVFAPHPLNRKLNANKKEFERAMMELLAAGKIRLEKVGPASKSHTEFVICAAA